MSADRNLLFGVLAHQTGLVNSQQLVDACMLWTSRKHVSIADLLIERGWILPKDRVHIDYLVERSLQKSGGDAKASLASVSDNVKRSLAALGDVDIQRSLIGLPQSETSACATVVNFETEPSERYTLIRLHATGGIGRVWLARDSTLGRDVALKELQPERAKDEMMRARFLREARITGQLEHPGIVPVYELTRLPDTQQPFYTMRFVKGSTLSEVGRAHHQKRMQGQVDSIEFLELLSAFVTICNTVNYAHSRGVIHRDLKGQNVVLGDFGEVVVLDWGLAKFLDQSDREASAVAVILDQNEAGSAEMTLQGQTLGTPAYMAPEQASGRLDLIDVRTDVYGLGAIFYEILTGQPPFTGSDTHDVMLKVLETEPLQPRLLWPDVPPALEAVCLRALAKTPGDRYAHAGELAQEVQQWQEVQRKQAEDALRASEALYHSLVETIPMNVWRKDAEGRFTFFNKGFCEATNRSRQEVVGRTDFDLFPAELAEKYRTDDAWVMATGKTIDTTEVHQTGTGESLYVRVIKLPVFDGQGRVIGTQGIFWDVTDRKRLEEALARTVAELALAQKQLQ